MFASKGIRTNVISPGPIETPILEGQFGENAAAMKERLKTMIPMGRMGKPEAIASAAVFLASDESSFITGIDLPVDVSPYKKFFYHCTSTRPPRGVGASCGALLRRYYSDTAPPFRTRSSGDARPDKPFDNHIHA
jgi:hypothetical protein